MPPGRRTRWKDRADDPELERELIDELDRRRRAREEDRERRALERRSRWVIWLFVLLTAAAAAAIGYGALVRGALAVRLSRPVSGPRPGTAVGIT